MPRPKKIKECLPVVQRKTKAIAKIETPIAKQEKEIEVITKQKISEYMTAFNMTNLSPQEQMQFIEIAVAYQLNPFKREIYCVPYQKSVKDINGKWIKERALSIITGYEVYLKRAERTGRLNGWKCEITGTSRDNWKAIATIYRKDWKNPFVHEVYFDEVVQKDKTDDGEKLRGLWAKMPKFMLKKVCIAQAFRLCFPDEFGGMPYIADELPQDMTDATLIKMPNYDLAENSVDLANNMTEEQKAEQDALDKLAALPDKIKQGFKALGYTAKPAWMICEEAEWDNDKIEKRINYIMDNKK